MATVFWEKYVELCNEKGVSPSAAAVDMGYSNATAAGWKKGSNPRDTAIQRAADYFGVPASVFCPDGSFSDCQGQSEKNLVSVGYQPAPPVAADMIKASLRGLSEAELLDLMLLTAELIKEKRPQ